MTMPAALPELPKLPEPFGYLERTGVWNGALREGRDAVFDDDQMHAYTRAYGESCRVGDGEDAARFRALQDMPPEKAQAFFWNYTSRKQRAKAIDAARNAKGERDAK